MTKQELAAICIARLKAEYPDSDCTLDYDHAWQLLVSVRLAAQCTDARVNVVVQELFAKYPGVKELAAADPADIEAIVKPCGLGHSKARDISACMRMLSDRYDCHVPDDFNALLALPGVGRKSANLIMGDVFGKPAIVTDTHCIRLCNRIGLVDNVKEPAKVERELWKIIPRRATASATGWWTMAAPCAQPAPSPTATNAAWRTYAGHERNFCMNKTTENRLGGELRSHHAARRLLEELRRGRYADAAQLPSELELADVLGVSRTVVRDALSDLERDGYLERVRGIGTLVNRDVVRVENRMDQKLEFNRMIRSIGRVPHSDNLMVTRETAMPELAAKLGLDPEREHTLVFVRRRVLADETPVLYSTDILPLALFGGKRLDTIDFSRPIFEIVEQHCHVEVTETLTTLHAVQGVPGIRRQLGLRSEQALLQLDEICYSRTCKPVLCCQTCYTDFFDFAMVRKLI